MLTCKEDVVIEDLLAHSSKLPHEGLQQHAGARAECGAYTHLQMEEASEGLHGSSHHGRPDVGRDVAHLRTDDAVRVLQGWT